MKKEVLNEIVLAINEAVPMPTRKANLRKTFHQRRGNNRKTVLTVIDILSEHVLPLRHDEDFHGHLLKDISDPVYNNLKLIWDQSTCPYYTAVAGEILWNHYHDKEIAERALEAYSVELAAPTIENEYMFTHISLSICRILKKYKSPVFAFAPFYDRCIQYVHEHADESGFCILFILRGLMACGLNVVETEQIYLALIERFRTNQNYSRAITFEEEWEKYCKELKQPRVEIQRKLAEDYERNADQYDWESPQHAHIIIKQIQSAMNVWSRINNGEESKQERQRLTKRIESVKRLVLQSGHVISGNPIDINEFVNKLKDFISTASFEEVVLELSNIVTIMTPDSVMEQLQRTGPSLADFFPTTLLDNQGRKICIVPSALDSDPEKRYNRLTYNAKQRYQISIDMAVRRYLHIAKEKVQFTKENLGFLVENNVFIPPDRKDSFLAGIQAGFELNLPLAMHVLMPQVENAVRVLAESCGAVVYKTALDGTEESLSMDSILNLPEVRCALDDEFLFNLQLFFTSVYGFGMRNIVAHGLESDEELQSLSSLAVWWYTLHLCCIYCPELYKRVREVQKSKIAEKGGTVIQAEK